MYFTTHRYSDSEPTIHCDPNAEKSYLSLEELGNILTGLTSILQRKLPHMTLLDCQMYITRLHCIHLQLVSLLDDLSTPESSNVVTLTSL